MSGFARRMQQAAAHLSSANGALSFDHVFLIALENSDRSTIIGSSSAPNINSYVSTYAQCTHYHSIYHPSLPNYFQVTTGSDQGTSGGDDTSPTISVSNVFANMTSDGISWKTYAENLPSPYTNWNHYTAGSPYDVGEYSSRHVPAVFFNSIMSSSTERAKVVDYTQLATDLSGGTVPQFAWITPNRIDDMHDGTVSQMDTWVGNAVSAIKSSTSWTVNKSLIILWWDEDGEDGQTNNQLVASVFIAKNVVSAGYSSSRAYGHLNVLSTIQSVLGVSQDLSGGAAVMSDLFS